MRNQKVSSMSGCDNGYLIDGIHIDSFPKPAIPSSIFEEVGRYISHSARHLFSSALQRIELRSVPTHSWLSIYLTKRWRNHGVKVGRLAAADVLIDVHGGMRRKYQVVARQWTLALSHQDVV